MTEPHIVRRRWTRELAPGVRLRAIISRRGKRVLDFVAQLEIDDGDVSKPIVRYDNAHGFCHCDLMNADGTQVKRPVMAASLGEAFTQAMKDLTGSWADHVARYQRQVRHGRAK